MYEIIGIALLSGLTTHFSPLGEAAFGRSFYALSRPVIPTLVEPVLDLLANETYWGGKIYPEKTPWDRRSRSARHYAPKTLTDKVLVGMTEKLNRMTGGSEYRSGVVDLGADSLSYLLDSYIGPTGGFLKRPFTMAGKIAAGESTTWNDWIILRRFLSETAPQYYVPGEFYDAVDDVERAVAERRWYKEGNGSQDDYARWQKHHGWKVGLEKDADRSAKILRELRDRPDADSQAIRDRALAVQRAFVKKYLQSERY
jgi:hypothetical protein